MKKGAIILSDTHGDMSNAFFVIEKFNEFNTIFHLGDLIEDAENIRKKFPDKKVYNVAGNNDFSYKVPYEQIILFEGKRILITHGHRQMVNFNLLNIVLWSKENNADAVLFGHTHVPFFEVDMGLVIFNPGSISLPRHSKKPTFGILTMSNDAEMKFEMYEILKECSVTKIL